MKPYNVNKSKTLRNKNLIRDRSFIKEDKNDNTRNY